MNPVDTFVLIGFYVVIQVFVFLTYGIDKFKAKAKKRRISEKTLLFVTLFAPFGALLGMLVFRHKIKKAYFWWTSIGMLALHFYLIFLF